MQSKKPPRASFDSTSFRSGRSLPPPTLQRETTRKPFSAKTWAIYEAILEHGPLDTVRLRREARMGANGNAVSASAKSCFDRALVELQVGLKVVPTGVAQAGAWNYAFIYELLPRWFPEIPEQARSIGRGEARRVRKRLFGK